MSEILHKIGIGLATAVAVVGGWIGIGDEPAPQPNLGATYQLPEVRALFETTLASRITADATSFTLTSATDKDGTLLASSTYGFIIDEGTASEEFVLADCTGTTCTNATRGISARTGTSTVTALKKAHGRGASVKMTDAPSLLYVINVFKGTQNIENKLRYSSAVSTAGLGADDQNIASVAYVNSVAFGAVPAASETSAGFAELATGAEAAAGTSANGSNRLILPASLATSTYNSATAANKVVVTNNTGKIDEGFLSISTSTAYSSTGLLTLGMIGKNMQVITNTGTSTFSVPSGVTRIETIVVGGGGAGGGAVDTDGACGTRGVCGGFGGGAGGTAIEVLDVTGTSTIQVFVGAAGQPSKFGTNGFYSQAEAGSSGGTGGGTGAGGAGGTATGGTLNIVGNAGAGGDNSIGGPGGGSMLGGGGAGGNAGADGAGSSAGYGGGGGGAGADNDGNYSGGAGGQGIIVIRW